MTSRRSRLLGGRRRRALGAVVGVVVLGSLTVAGITLRPHDGAALPALPQRSGPAAYRVLYRVEVHQQPPSVTFEERIVRRPFEGRLLAGTTRRLERTSPDTSGTLSVGNAVYSLTGDEVRLVQWRIPSSAIGDQSLAAVLDDAVDAGLAERLEAPASVLDRPCRQFVTREPGAAVLMRPTDQSRATVCIDEAGLVLRERWELRGELVLERTAVELDEDPSADALSAALDPSGGPGTLPSTASVRAVDELDSFLDEPIVPAGFRLEGRYESATLDQVLGPLASSAWVMSGRGHFVVVEAGTGQIRLDRGLRRTSATGLGRGVVYLGWSGSEIRMSLDDGRWVRVTSSAPARWLEEYVATLRLVE